MNLWLGTTKKKKKKSYLQADGEILENSRKHRKNILLGIFTTFYFEILIRFTYTPYTPFRVYIHLNLKVGYEGRF